MWRSQDQENLVLEAHEAYNMCTSVSLPIKGPIHKSLDTLRPLLDGTLSSDSNCCADSVEPASSPTCLAGLSCEDLEDTKLHHRCQSQSADRSDVVCYISRCNLPIIR